MKCTHLGIATCALVVAALPLAAAQSPDRDDSIEVIAELDDGSLIRGQPMFETVAMSSRFGDLDVPIDSLRFIDFAVRNSDSEHQRFRELIDRLDDDGLDERPREAARLALRRRGREARPVLQEVLAQTQDESMKRRIRGLLAIIPEDRSASVDQLKARGLAVDGRLRADGFDISCVLGTVHIEIDMLRRLEVARVGQGLQADFEDGLEGWVAASSTPTAWHRVERGAASGRGAVWCGIPGTQLYGDSAYATLTSPSVDISEAVKPALSFRYRAQMEEEADGFAIEASVDGGRSWEVLHALRQSSAGWVPVRVDLSHLSGRSHLQVRLVFTSDGSETREGVYVDDVHIGESRQR